MNYRHAFHAGNFADVLKHAALALALRRLTAKPKPLRVIDTHAGIGNYRLDASEAERTGEWKTGIARLVGPDALAIPPEIAALLAPYLDAVRAANRPGEIVIYPGSPALALALLRAEDRLVASELHPEDVALLRNSLRGDRRAKVLALDGWQALRALLPPKERRGIVLVDPPFEEPRELQRLRDGLVDGLRRFATGTYILWLPIKDQHQIAGFEMAIRELDLEKILWAELRVAPIAAIGPLAATALVIVNPPFGLAEELAVLLPFLSDRLASEPGSGGWQLRTI
jgi:23S rRNA (adenine2030-N6)-methyltransferase